LEKERGLKVLTRRSTRGSRRRVDLDPEEREEAEKELARAMLAGQFSITDGLPGNWNLPPEPEKKP